MYRFIDALIRHLHEMDDKVFRPYGFYDAFSKTDNWYPHSALTSLKNAGDRRLIVMTMDGTVTCLTYP